MAPAAGRDAGCGYHGGGNGLDSSYAFGGPGKLVPGGGGGNIRTTQQLCQRFRGEHVRGKRLNLHTLHPGRNDPARFMVAV